MNEKHELYEIIELKVLIELTESECWSFLFHCVLLLSKRVLERIVEYKEVSERLMWVKIMVGGLFWVFISAYGPGSERSEGEKEAFLE